MRDEQAYNTMIMIAFATPALALLMHFFAGRAGIVSIRRGRMVVLFLAGPANLLLWIIFNKYLDGVGNNSALGIALAAIVFVATGYGLGRWRGGRPSESSGTPTIAADQLAQRDDSRED